MRTLVTRTQHICFACSLLVGAAPGAAGQGHPTIPEPQIHWSDEREELRIDMDNDLFGVRNHDRDYTGGIGFTLSGERAREGWLSLDPLLRRLDVLSGGDMASETYFARQLGLLAFTPSNTLVSESQPDDRPYASLLFLSNGRVRVDEDARGAWASSLTIGMLGLSISESLHSAVHEWIGTESPQGYDHQISAGGEPTARYTLARQKLWIASPSGHLDVKTTLQGSVGFLTEASAAVSVRTGQLASAWWGSAPELTDYMAAPVPSESYRGGRERYFFVGARVKARAYNSFLQGQFRESEVRHSADEIAPLLAEAWVGAAIQLRDQTRLSYSLHYQTAELRDGPAARDLFWGTLQLTHAFSWRGLFKSHR